MTFARRLVAALILAAVLRGTVAGKSSNGPVQIASLPLRNEASHALHPLLPCVRFCPGPLAPRSPETPRAEDRRAARCPDRCRSGECQPGGERIACPTTLGVLAADTRSTRCQVQRGSGLGRIWPVRTWVRRGRVLRGPDIPVHLRHRSDPRQHKKPCAPPVHHRLDEQSVVELSAHACMHD